MPVHFIHVGKTGGSAIKQAIREAGEPETRFGKIFLHPHPFTLAEVPPDHPVFFSVRDPMARFVSSFYSRLRKGRPKYFREWTDSEREVFTLFETPQALAAGLVSSDAPIRTKALAAMSEIRQLRREMRIWLESPALLKQRSGSIVYIARQETLAQDWEQIKEVLALPDDLELPSDPKAAHRSGGSEDRSLDQTATRALMRWYAKDYRLLAFCERLRRERGWGSPVEGPTTGTMIASQASWALLRLRRRVSQIRVPS